MNTESAIRLGCFIGVLTVLALAEHWWPRRPLAMPGRKLHNLALVVVNTLALRLLPALSATAVAVLAREQDWGLLHILAVPDWLAFVLALLALDLVIYLQHVLFHAVPLLWRLHLVHHADLEFDATTGLRFHTLEILLSMGIKMAAVLALGAPALAVLTFEIVLNAIALFSHANLHLSERLDRWLRLLVVTPDMHRVHHSVLPRETNSNFGFNLPWWDWLFGTYCPQPEAGHTGMTIGLPTLRERWVNRLPWMLALPFLRRERRPASSGIDRALS